MPPVEDMLASCLSHGEASALKALPSKPLQTTSWLNGKAYAVAGQASGNQGEGEELP